MIYKTFICDYFSDKWMLYPKILRYNFLHNINKNENKNEMLLITSLKCYEENHINYDEKNILSNFVFYGSVSIQEYINFTSKFLNKMNLFKLGNFILSNELKTKIKIITFNKVINQIKNEVAYRPNNVAYEEIKERFYINMLNLENLS